MKLIILTSKIHTDILLVKYQLVHHRLKTIIIFTPLVACLGCITRQRRYQKLLVKFDRCFDLADSDNCSSPVYITWLDEI